MSKGPKEEEEEEVMAGHGHMGHFAITWVWLGAWLWASSRGSSKLFAS